MPQDYYEQETDRERFLERYLNEARRFGLNADETAAEEEWQAFLTGIYGVCLRRVTPENIARKTALIRDIDAQLANPQPSSRVWKERLHALVDELDALEMPFSPVYDRERFGRLPTRDTYIHDVRNRLRHST